MKKTAITLSISAALLMLTGSHQPLNAQILGELTTQINHSFVVDNTTLPAGKYTFRAADPDDPNLMTAQSADGKTTVEFLVRQSQSTHTPKHAEVSFRKYGSTEFLNELYQGGTTSGVKVEAISRREKRLEKQSRAIVHTEGEQ